MFRLNVAAQQLEECVKQGMFALPNRPQINVGEILLLQLKKSDWQLQGAKSGRIQHALVFQRVEHDAKGSISKKHWPNAGKTWQWILYASSVLDVEPFSLEDLPLKRDSHYQAQANPVRIDSEDEAVILPYINWPSTTSLTLSDQESNLEVPMATDNILDVESFSVTRAVSAAKQWFPRAQIEVMKHNNAGFDLIATEKGKVVRYIEVKGTRVAAPVFHLTETERKFSVDNAALYTLAVVWEIDLARKTCNVKRHDGEIPVGSILRPERYIGKI
jgi:hypothetical protein